MKKPILITTLGYPGSGKSYFAENLAKKYRFFHINADKTRHTIFEKPTFTREETLGVFRMMDLITEELLQKGINVIYDANMNFKAHRKRLERIAKRCNALHRLVWIQTDVPTAEKRITKRSKTKQKNLMYPPLETWILHKLKDEMEKPTKSEPVVIIDGHVSFSKQLQQLKQSVRL